MKKIHTILLPCLAIVCAVLLLTACNSKSNTFKENPDMEYRTLGSTGLRVGVIGLGCDGLGKKYCYSCDGTGVKK